MWKWTIFCTVTGAAAVIGSLGNDTNGTLIRCALAAEKSDMPQPDAVQFVGTAFSTDLPLAECKEPIHRVWLQCRLADGGSGILFLDPTVPKFNKFGEPTADGKPAPIVRLDCILKLIKKAKIGTLYEIRGPKIVSRLSLAAYKDITPWGDGRFLVHGKGGEVRYVIDLYIPRPKP